MRLAAVAMSAACGLAGLAVPTIAHAGTSRPELPTSVQLVRVTPSSFTVSAIGAHNAHQFRLFASTTRSNLFVRNIKAATKSHLSSSPTVALHGLKYAAEPYYYRLEVFNGQRHRFSSTIYSVGLLPAVPTDLAATVTMNGTFLTWSSGPASGFQITEATDEAMTQDVRTFTTSGMTTSFTPPDLVAGTTYYFEVAALNNDTASAPTSPVSAVPETDSQDVRVMTYNILESFDDGRAEGGGHVAPWSERVNGVVNYIRQGAPDVVAIEEGAGWAYGSKGPRQVDQVVSELGDYSLADTEIPPTEPHYLRTGVYVLYKTSEYTAIGQGDHWDLGDTRWAAYQILQNNVTGATFLMVAAHLLVGQGAAYDKKREAETTNLLSLANAYAAANGNIPIVYAGDFNSDNARRRTFNAPAVVMQGADVSDAFNVAVHKSMTKYDSANGYMRKPPKFSERLDYVWAPQGVAVTSWTQLLNLNKGKVVGVIPSDHNPVVAGVQVPYAPPAPSD